MTTMEEEKNNINNKPWHHFVLLMNAFNQLFQYLCFPKMKHLTTRDILTISFITWINVRKQSPTWQLAQIKTVQIQGKHSDYDTAKIAHLCSQWLHIQWAHILLHEKFWENCIPKPKPAKYFQCIPDKYS